MVELNLLPDVKKEFLQAQRARNRVIATSILAMIISVGAIVALGFFVYVGQAGTMWYLTGQVKDKENRLKNIPDINKYVTLQNQLANITPLHEDKEVYSRLLSYLTVLNPVAPNNVELGSLQVDSANKEIVFTGTTKSFEAFNVFKDTLLNAELISSEDENAGEKLFSSVNVESSSLGQVRSVTAVTFVVRATYLDTAFVASNKDSTLKVPTMETTQSVRQTPASLFNSNTGGNE